MEVITGVVNEPPVPNTLPPDGRLYQLRVPGPVADSMVVVLAQMLVLEDGVVLTGSLMTFTVTLVFGERQLVPVSSAAQYVVATVKFGVM